MTTSESTDKKKRPSDKSLLNRLKAYFSVDEEIAQIDTHLSEENKKILRKFKDLD